MSKSNKGGLIAIVVVILLVLWAVVAGISFNNKAVQQEEGVRQASRRSGSLEPSQSGSGSSC